jgi:3-dehydroquinate synthase
VRRLEVPIPGAAYPVVVGPGALAELSGFLSGRVVVVADPAAGDPHGLDLPLIEVEGGERAKTMAGVERLLAEFERRKIGRDGTVVAVGGGSIGDLAGFAASIWQRGVALVQVPTTLLAMVDSSIGGKTGVNTAAAKNAIGTFWQPRAVLADTRYLETLPPEQMESGWAEVVKYAMTLDPGIGDLKDLEEVVERSVRCKAGVVAADEREEGLREVLNYGHTAGHGIEAASAYRVSHGRSIAWGMRIAARISSRLDLCDPSLGEEQDALLARHGLPGPAPEVSVEAVLAASEADKKSRGGERRWVLLRGRGRAEAGHPVPERVVAEVVSEILHR